jgi:hypothetical protein
MIRIINPFNRIWIFVVVCIATNLTVHSRSVRAMVMTQQHTTTSRRTLLSRIPFAIIGTASSVILSTNDDITRNIKSNKNIKHNINCSCAQCCQHSPCSMNSNTFIVNAYERRDVGDENSSAETKAMNDQAYETNNRLERDGFKLEVCFFQFFFFFVIHF